MDNNEGYQLRSRRNPQNTLLRERYRCQACDIEFQTPLQLGYHLFYGLSLQFDDIHFLKLSLNLEQLPFPPGVQVQPCAINPQTTTSQKQPLVCVQCKKTFKNSKGLNQHIGKMHSCDLKSYTCSVCHRKFKNKYALKFHQNQVHKKTTMVKCEECGKSIYNKYQLQKHMKTHEVAGGPEQSGVIG